VRLVRFIKILHTLGAIGMMGGLAACMVLVLSGPRASTAAFATVRHTIDALHTWLVLPSMLVCVFSGFLSMFVHKPYWNALWAWLKAIPIHPAPSRNARTCSNWASTRPRRAPSRWRG
jgi:hypothetical protein